MTPLLSQWTYQAMVHELVGINNGRVTIESENRQDLRVSLLVYSQSISILRPRLGRTSSSIPTRILSTPLNSSPTLATSVPRYPPTYNPTKRARSPSITQRAWRRWRI